MLQLVIFIWHFSFLWNRNPLYLLGLFVAFLLSKALWVQLDVPREFQHGAVSSMTPILQLFQIQTTIFNSIMFPVVSLACWSTLCHIKVSSNCYESSKEACGRSSRKNNSRSTRILSFPKLQTPISLTLRLKHSSWICLIKHIIIGWWWCRILEPCSGSETKHQQRTRNRDYWNVNQLRSERFTMEEYVSV